MIEGIAVVAAWITKGAILVAFLYGCRRLADWAFGKEGAKERKPR